MSGKLTANCPGVYFPATLEPDLSPVPFGKVIENCVKLTWVSGSQPFTGAVLFKVKSSTPSRFHVHPRFGAIDIVDGAGKAAEVTISLRGKDGTEARAGCSSLMSSQSENGSEKFLVEYFLATRPDVVSAVHASSDSISPKRMGELYEELKSSASATGKVLLRGYLDHVFTEEQLKYDSKLQEQEIVFVVPTTAAVAYQAKLTSRLSVRTAPSQPTVSQQDFRDRSLDTITPGQGDAITPPRSSSNLQRLAEMDEETHKLRMELDHLRRQLEEATRDKREIEAAVTAAKAADASRDLLSASQQEVKETKKKGVPFLVVIALMVLTFASTFYCRLARGWGSSSFSDERPAWPLG